MKIICIGRNYPNHVKELNNEVPREPVFFMKPDSSLLRNNDPFYIPEWTNDVHHEVELILKISRVGKCIEKCFAHRYYHEIGLGVDFTARDIQAQLIKEGLPWEKSKAFDRAAAVGPQFIPLKSLANPQEISFRLEINGQPVQQGNSADMIFGFDAIISFVSRFVSLKMGDLIYTGTPVGVGAVKPDDRLEGFIEERKMFDFRVK